jgi:hypothetical protein
MTPGLHSGTGTAESPVPWCKVARSRAWMFPKHQIKPSGSSGTPDRPGMDPDADQTWLQILLPTEDLNRRRSGRAPRRTPSTSPQSHPIATATKDS